LVGGKDFDLIREFNPLGRVPTLVLDDDESLIESAAILDYLDDLVGPHGRCCRLRAGTAGEALSRHVHRRGGLRKRACCKFTRRCFAPRRSAMARGSIRCRVQMHGALAELERAAAGRSGWLVGERMTQADITTTCVFTFLRDALGSGPPGPILVWPG